MLAYAYGDFQCFAKHYGVMREVNTAAALDAALADMERDRVDEIEALARIGLSDDPSASWLCPARVAQRIGERLTLWVYGPLRSNLSSLLSALHDNADASGVIVRIDSPGGLFVQTLDLARALMKHRARKLAIIDRTCWSAAVLVSAACDRVFVRANATMMVHPTRHHAAGDSEELMQAVIRARTARSRLSNVHIGAVARFRESSSMKSCRGNISWGANEAVEFGFADRVISPLPNARPEHAQ